MGDLRLNLDEQLKEDGFVHYVTLIKDQKLICRTQCVNPPGEVPSDWHISSTIRISKIHSLSGLPSFFLLPACQSSRDHQEWGNFLGFLQQHDRVAITKFEVCEFYILPPEKDSSFGRVTVAYRMEKAYNRLDGPQLSLFDEPHTQFTSSKALIKTTKSCGVEQPRFTCRSRSLKTTVREASVPSFHMIEEFADRSDAHMRVGGSAIHRDESSPNLTFPRVRVHAHESRLETCGRTQNSAIKQDSPLGRNYVHADPSYLKTLGHAHSGWIFGAIAELVDNSRDAKATRLDILIETIYLKKAGKDIPMLSVIDDGHGMTHKEIVKMTSFGHKQPDEDDMDHIGRFGIGFKTGAMRLGRDALVLTQTANSRSIAFLSQTLNEGKENLEIPIVSYCRQGHFMELDTYIQNEALAKYNLKAIKEFSPFNKYLIGEKAGLFSEKATGTQIFIWNLDEWGSGYCLDWQNGTSGGSSFHQGDIFIRSRRIRSRPGQISQKVPLDYSLRAYLEVIFLNPRMKIYVQSSLVKSRPLAKSLKNTVVESGNVMGKPVQLILGCCQLDWEQANGGMFLYWHGRLIEAYKRVGGMIHNAAVGRGLIGVVDVTDLMNDGNGHVWVHNTKQGFQDCEAYALMEDWLGKKVDEHWDKNFDKLQLKKATALYKPDNEWVQCDKCRKWRMLSSGFNIRSIPQQWFCYMKPFSESCEIPEQKVEPGVITVSTKRSGHNLTQTPLACEDNVPLVNATSMSGANNNGDDGGGGEDEDSSKTVEDEVVPCSGVKKLRDSSKTVEDREFILASLKRIRRGPSRSCKKA